MSFEELAQKIASHPEMTAQATERARAGARKAWHELWLSDIYPHWQGPMVAMSRKAGIETTRHMVSQTLPPLELPEEVLRLAGLIERTPPRTYVVSEVIDLVAVVPVAVHLFYCFAGDENDGALLRFVAIREMGHALVLPQHAKIWTGPKDKLSAAAIADVADAGALFGPLILQAHNAMVVRLDREKAEREEAERKAAAEEAERARLAEEERKRQEEAALTAAAELEAAAVVKPEP